MRLAPLAFAILLGAAALAAACSSSDSAPTAASGGCTYNSDCASGLVCAYGSCRQECVTSVDCPKGTSCVKYPSGTNYCQTPDAVECSATAPCPESLTCDSNGACRNACTSSADCVTGQLCKDALCVEPDAVDAGPDSDASSDAAVDALSETADSSDEAVDAQDSADEAAEDASDAPDDASDASDPCTASGGTVDTAMCCQATNDFPGTCGTGACGCSPMYSHQVKICVCPSGQCFSGTACVNLE